ncbi:putative DNA glycosylase At3g47830 isoform X2 [Chenopodium quinoa]|uniref:putative DNA glycosylase At3g47830 isoform X2 n=1 Tax=Chenopodium quinoa TaxID=63459 RepID=UPI000B7722B3|nr:putative DNA glycosylase At3g47830 isoform X2 [Chenopodium quinoa]
MQNTRKRKQIFPKNNKQQSEITITKIKSNKTKKNPKTDTIEPYPSHPRPTPEDCLAIRDELLEFQGFPEEFAKYRDERENPELNSSKLINGSEKSEVSAEKLSVLDGLVSIVLSQNTTDVNSQKAFGSLKAAFPTWELVLAADQNLLENAIRCGGLAPTKASCIRNILSCLKERSGKLCLEYLRDLSIDEIKSELSSFKGIGPKTVACVLMFHLQLDDFPVDTHIATTLGWVPEGADAKKTYLHLNRRIPNELKFDLNCLLFTHGKMCNRCSTKTVKQEKKESVNKPCPLLNHCKKSD